MFQIREDEYVPTFTVAESDQEEFFRLTDENVEPTYNKIFKLELLDSGGGKYKLSDEKIFYRLICDGILVRTALKNELEDFLGNVGYWVNFEFKGEKYYYFHTTNVIDAINYETSGCRYIEGYMVSINPIIFKELDYANSPLFRVPREDGTPIWLFASELFFSKLEELGVKGVKARKPQI